MKEGGEAEKRSSEPGGWGQQGQTKKEDLSSGGQPLPERTVHGTMNSLDRHSIPGIAARTVCSGDRL